MNENVNLNKWFVIRMTVNMSGGNAEEVKRFDTEKEARDTFYKWNDSYGTNPQTKYYEALLINPSGDTIRIEKIDNAKYIVADVKPE